jgi:hypothetical protein
MKRFCRNRVQTKPLAAAKYAFDGESSTSESMVEVDFKGSPVLGLWDSPLLLEKATSSGKKLREDELSVRPGGWAICSQLAGFSKERPLQLLKGRTQRLPLLPISPLRTLRHNLPIARLPLFKGATQLVPQRTGCLYFSLGTGWQAFPGVVLQPY